MCNKYKLTDLVDLKQLDSIMESFSNAIEISTAVLDEKGKILTAHRWSDICIKFHRVDTRTNLKCTKSDTDLASQLQNKKEFSYYRCLNGLIDVATPIIIEGNHLGNIFIGQFFESPPDINFFKKQAEEFDFDKDEYLKVLSKVPIMSYEKAELMMKLLSQLAGYISSLGLKEKKRSEAEEKIKDIAKFPNENPNPVLRFSNTGELLYSNDASKFLLEGWGIKDDKLLPQEILNNTLKISGLKTKEKIEITVKDRIFALTLTPILNSSYVNIYGEDITDIKKIEKEQENIKNQLIHSSKLAAIGELAAGIAHEINNPLAIINGYGDMLSSILSRLDIHNDGFKKCIDEQKDGVERIKTIVDGLRVYARMDEDIKECVNVTEIIKYSTNLIKSVYERNDDIFIEQEISNENLFIYGNRGRFQQIIMNLLSNAKDAMKDISRGIITVKASGSDKFVELSISDQGYGIKEEDKNRIFDTFFSTKETGEGTGMGLSIVASLVKELNGTIKVVSEEKVGVKFLVTLPRYYTNEEEGVKEGDRVEDALKIDLSSDFEQLEGHILIVDDEKSIREMLRLFLEMFGLSVEEAENGEVALSKIKNNYYNVVITDIVMPKMKGDQLIEKMAEIGYLDNSKVFVVTGSIDEAVFSNNSVLNQFEIEIIKKPFSRDTVYEKLSGCLKKPD